MKRLINGLLDNSFMRFIIVGVLNTLIGTAAMLVCYDYLGMGYWLSSAMNYVVGSIFSYFANKYFTFKNKSQSKRDVIRFIVNIGLCYFFAYGIAKPLTNYLLVSVMNCDMDNQIITKISMFVGMGIFVVINYLGQRKFVFVSKNEDEGVSKR